MATGSGPEVDTLNAPQSLMEGDRVRKSDGENDPVIDAVALARASAAALVGANDRVSPDEAERLGIHFLQQLMNDLGPLKERSHSIHPVTGGLLAREDLATPYERISNQIEYLIAVSFDSLEMLSLFLQSHGLPMVGGYPLIRSSVEATAYALWVLGGGTMDKRIFNSLRLTWDNHRNADFLAQKLGNHNKSRTARTRARLNEIKNMRPGNRQKNLDRAFPSITDILTDLQRRFAGNASLKPLDAWSACSGMAHGNKAVAISMLELRQMGPSDGVGAEHLATSSFALTAMLFHTATELLTHLISKYEEHSALV